MFSSHDLKTQLVHHDIMTYVTLDRLPLRVMPVSELVLFSLQL